MNRNLFLLVSSQVFAFTAANVEHSDEVEKTYSIKIINNFDNDKNQYKADYISAYASLTKVPELNERNY